MASTVMTLNEAIRNARAEACVDGHDADEHDQLAGWLEELRDLRASMALLDISDAALTPLEPFTKWAHRKGGSYVVVGVGHGCGGLLEGKSLVVYEDLTTRCLWVRGSAEFLDGRFISMD